MRYSLYIRSFALLSSVLFAMEKEPNSQQKKLFFYQDDFKREDYSLLNKKIIALIDTETYTSKKTSIKIHSLIIELSKIADDGASFIAYSIIRKILVTLEQECKKSNSVSCRAYWDMYREKMLDDAWENLKQFEAACELLDDTGRSSIITQIPTSDSDIIPVDQSKIESKQLVKAQSERLPNNRIAARQLNKTRSENLEKHGNIHGNPQEKINTADQHSYLFKQLFRHHKNQAENLEEESSQKESLDEQTKSQKIKTRFEDRFKNQLPEMLKRKDWCNKSYTILFDFDQYISKL